MLKFNTRLKILSSLIYFIDIALAIVFIIFKQQGFFNKIPYLDIILVFCIVFISCFYLFLVNLSLDKVTKKNHSYLADTFGSDISNAFIFGGIGIANYSDNNEIFWVSNLFKERNIDLLGVDIIAKFPKLKEIIDGTSESNEIEITLNECIYKVICIKEIHALIFQDINEIKTLYKKDEDEASVVLRISYENLNENRDILEQDYDEIEIKMKNIIKTFADEYNILLVNVSEKNFIGFCEYSDLVKIKHDKFNVINKLNNLGESMKAPLTISIGVGQSASSFNELFNLAEDALEVAESRGGNQAVVNGLNSQLEFYGATASENRSTSSLKKNKSFAYSLPILIKKYKKIYVVPHNNADLDAIGASAGFCSICSSFGISSQIVLQEKQVEIKSRMPLKNLFSNEVITKFLISEQKALQNFDDENTLTVLLDCNNHKISTAPSLLQKSTNVIIIDHHRTSVDTLDYPKESFFDTNASSTCEILAICAGLMPYKIRFSNEVTTLMLAGIMLDTQIFKDKVSNNTFKACSFLKEKGANEKLANSFFLEQYEEYILKNKIISSISNISNGVFMMVAPSDEIIDKTMLAICAGEVLNIQGVSCSFAIGKISDEEIGISARSDGNINVQLIMEKMGGGGHYTASATKIKSKDLNSIISKLKENVLEYINEN